MLQAFVTFPDQYPLRTVDVSVSIVGTENLVLILCSSNLIIYWHYFVTWICWNLRHSYKMTDTTKEIRMYLLTISFVR